MMPHILLIDDDLALSTLLTEYLTDRGYRVSASGDGYTGLREVFETKPDLVLLDVTMPRQDGWETLKRIRDLSDVPVIMLTARDDEVDVLHGFSLGADDYVVKPFSFAQIAARIGAVLSRSGKDLKSNAQMLQVGALQIDLEAKRVMLDGKIIKLTPTEYKLLVALAQHPGNVLSPEDLVREVWGPQYADEVGNVRRYIWHLRQKVEADPENPVYIHNERGYGYSVYDNLGKS
jgi:two-component system KDP operon response regulator KdpE